MRAASSRSHPRLGGLALAAALAGALSAALGAAILALVITVFTEGNECVSPAASGEVVLGPPGRGQLVGASEYGGPGDPSSGTVGSSGASLLAHPDSYAELGGYTFQTATALGGLPYMRRCGSPGDPGRRSPTSAT